MTEKRILLVEDEATTREIMTEFLRGEGYAIDSVATASAAATCLRTIPYALVIVDWGAPDRDGIDVADSAVSTAIRWFSLVTSPNLPDGVPERHRALSKHLDRREVLSIVRGAIGAPP